MGYIRVYLGNVLKTQVELNSDRFTIGRAKDNDLILNDPGVSSRHATIIRDGTKYNIEDNDSTNGVFVNKQRIKKAELKYWDEIQIYNHILKFMALTSRDEGDDLDITGQKKAVTRTQVVDISGEGLQSLLRHYQKKNAYLTLYHTDGKETRFLFPKESTLTIGGSKGCDIQTGGWFAPRTAAELERHKKGYYLIPHPRGKVALNGERVQDSRKLEDGDSIEVRNLSLRFFHRFTGDQ